MQMYCSNSYGGFFFLEFDKHVTYEYLLNSLPNDAISNLFKLKAFAYDKINVT